MRCAADDCIQYIDRIEKDEFHRNFYSLILFIFTKRAQRVVLQQNQPQRLAREKKAVIIMIVDFPSETFPILLLDGFLSVKRGTTLLKFGSFFNYTSRSICHTSCLLNYQTVFVSK